MKRPPVGFLHQIRSAARESNYDTAMKRTAFNPYLRWLGLPETPRNYYELLGLSRGEQSGIRIALAATALLDRLRDADTSEHPAAQQRMVKQIETARDCLLDETRRAAYDRRLAETQGGEAGTEAEPPPISPSPISPSPQPRPQPSSPIATLASAIDPMAPVAPMLSIDPMAPVAPVFPAGSVTSPSPMTSVDPMTPAVSMAPADSNSAPGPVVNVGRTPSPSPVQVQHSPRSPDIPAKPPGAADSVAVAPVAVGVGKKPSRSRTRRGGSHGRDPRGRTPGRGPKPQWWAYGLATVVFSMLAGVLAVLLYQQLTQRPVADRPTATPASEVSRSSASASASASPDSDRHRRPMSNSPARSSQVADDPISGDDDPSMELQVTVRPSARAERRQGMADRRDKVPGAMESRTPASTSMSQTSVSQMSVSSSSMDGDEAARTAMRVAEASNVAGLEPRTLDAAAVAELETALVPIWAALQERRLEDARRMLARAQSIAAGSDVAARVARYEVLVDYVGQFWEAVDEGMEELAGNELQLERGPVFVVELNDTHLVVRVRGVNRRFPRDQLPPQLVLAIADRWLDAQASSSPVFRGAFLAVTPRFTRSQVLDAWREAQSRGAPLGDLPAILDERPE